MQETAVLRVKLHISAYGSTTYAGELPADFGTGEDERGVCAGENQRTEIVREVREVKKVMKKIALITGVTGQDGSYLSEFLLDKGYRNGNTCCCYTWNHKENTENPEKRNTTGRRNKKRIF